MERKPGPGIKVPPPAIFLVAFLIGVWIEAAVIRLRIAGTDDTPRALLLAGIALTVLGAFVAILGAMTFRRHGTSILPFRAATALVQGGPYRFTRNPMYLGMALAHLGGALTLNAMWPIILLPMALVILFRIVIRKEEAHLAETFGEDYAAYRRRVRRWL